MPPLQNWLLVQIFRHAPQLFLSTRRFTHDPPGHLLGVAAGQKVVVEEYVEIVEVKMIVVNTELVNEVSVLTKVVVGSVVIIVVADVDVEDSKTVIAIALAVCDVVVDDSTESTVTVFSIVRPGTEIRWLPD